MLFRSASIGCTIGFLTTAIFGSFSTHGVLSGVVGVVLYGLGMSLLVTALTVSLGLARSSLVRSMKGLVPLINRLSSMFMMATGTYLTWYWYVAITERETLGPIASPIERAQSRLATLLQEVGSWSLAAIFVGILVVAATIVRRSARTGSPR